MWKYNKDDQKYQGADANYTDWLRYDKKKLTGCYDAYGRDKDVVKNKIERPKVMF